MRLMDKPHIVHILTSLRTGGAETFTVNLLRALDREKYNLTLITLYAPESSNFLLKQLELARIPYLHLQKNLGFDPQIAFSLRTLFKRCKPDLIHSHMYTIKYILFSQLGSQLPPWVHTIHSLAQSEFTIYEKIISSALYRLKMIKPVAVSECVRQSFYELYGIPNIAVIHNGIPFFDDVCEAKHELRKRLGIKEDGFIIISVSRLAPPKNPHLLIDAFHIVNKKLKKSFLYIIGDGIFMHELREKIASLGLNERVFLKGNINPPYQYLRAADLFILCSNAEGLPISLLEAMAAGLPVIASNVGGIPEVIEDNKNGYLVPPNDVSALADAIIKIFENPQRLQIGKNNQEKIRVCFNIRRTALQYEKIYDQMLSR